MLNTSFLNKIQLKIKHNFYFYFTESDPVQFILSFGPNPIRPEQYSMHSVRKAEFLTFLYLRFGQKKYNIESINNKLLFSLSNG